jgi:hypothetical protein
VIRWRRSALAVSCALAFGAAAALAGVSRAQPPPGAEACHVSGTVTVTPKLACPFDLLEVTLLIHTECPAEVPPSARWMHVVHSLPDAVQPGEAPDGQAPAGSPALERVLASPADVVTVTHTVRVTSPGGFTLNGARVRLMDDSGGQVSAQLQPAVVVVSPNCPGRRPLYLPLLDRPSCVPQALPADVVLVVDRSTSVGSSGLDEAARHLRGTLDALDLGRDRLGLVVFDQRASLLAPLGSSRADIEKALGKLTAAPGTRLERAIRAGQAELTGPRAGPGRRRVMVLLTDGVQIGPGDASVVLTAAAEAREAGTTILSLALGPQPNQVLLSAISGNSGQTISPGGGKDLAEAYRALADAAACAR